MPELKTFYEMQTRSARASMREAKNQKLELDCGLET